MESKNIVIKIGQKEFNISNDSPNFSELLEYYINNLSCEIENLTIECDNANFDSDLFKEVIVDTLNEIKDNLKLEKDKWQGRLKQHQ